MRIPLGWVTVVVLAAAAAAGWAQDPPRADPAAIDTLVRQLGSEKYAEREAARKGLEAIGSPALPALRKAKMSDNLEVQQRASELIDLIERRGDSSVAFTATKVRLKADKARLADVLRDLARQSKVKVLLAREPVDLGDRPVTLDTGEVPFWQALDALCQAAKVSLRPPAIDPNPPEVPKGTQRPQPNLPGVILMPEPVLGTPEYSLVLQDGPLPEQPVVHLGAVRLRLVPDGRKQGDEARWIVELLCEPRISWKAGPTLRWEPTTDAQGRRIAPVTEEEQTAAAGGNPNAVAMAQVFNGMPGPEAPPGVVRHELAVKAARPAGGAMPELKALLSGQMQLPPGPVVTIEDVLKADPKVAVGGGDYRLTVTECKKQDDGTVRLKVELEGPNQQANAPNVMVQRQFRLQIQMANGMPPAFGGLSMDGGVQLHLTDTTGRPYKGYLTGTNMNSRNGQMTQGYTFLMRPAAADATPGKLELHAPRTATVEAPVTFKNVKLP